MTMNVLVTGANGFLGTNLVKALSNKPDINILTHTRSDDLNSLYAKLAGSDYIFHLAGVNKSQDANEFLISNVQLTQKIVKFLFNKKIKSPIYFSSSIHSANLSSYGKSKLACELLFSDLKEKNGNNVIIDRLPRVFGPGARPNYNSAIATMCYSRVNNNIFNLTDTNEIIEICYVGDWIDYTINSLLNKNLDNKLITYRVSIGFLYNIFDKFSRNMIDCNIPYNPRLCKKLYLTYYFYLKNNLKSGSKIK